MFPHTSTSHSRLDVQLCKIDGIGQSARTDLTNMREDEKDDRESRESGGPGDAMFTSHDI